MNFMDALKIAGSPEEKSVAAVKSIKSGVKTIQSLVSSTLPIIKQIDNRLAVMKKVSEDLTVDEDKDQVPNELLGERFSVIDTSKLVDGVDDFKFMLDRILEKLKKWPEKVEEKKKSSTLLKTLYKDEEPF